MKAEHTRKFKCGIFSFFAGAGFLDLGFDKTPGFETLFVNEFHSPFMDIYKASRKRMGIRKPIFGYSTEDICSYLDEDNSKFLEKSITASKKRFDYVGFIGGPPCPDFSIAGKNRGAKGENGKLSAVYIELIIKNQPDFFLFENVKGLYRTKKHKLFFEEIKLQLIANGYYLTEKLINSLEYGVPQDRERIILIGFKKELLIGMNFKLNGSPFLYSFNWNTGIIYKANKVLAEPWPKLEAFNGSSSRPCPPGINKKLTVQYWFNKNDVTNHPNASHYFQPRQGLQKFLAIPEGDDLKKSYKRLHRWRYSPTAAYGNNEVHLHPFEARRISVSEALAIQSMPKNFVIPDDFTLTNMFKTIGNGVPFLAAKGIAEAIKVFIEENKNSDHEKINGR